MVILKKKKTLAFNTITVVLFVLTLLHLYMVMISSIIPLSGVIQESMGSVLSCMLSQKGVFFLIITSFTFWKWVKLSIQIYGAVS